MRREDLTPELVGHSASHFSAHRGAVSCWPLHACSLSAVTGRAASGLGGKRRRVSGRGVSGGCGGDSSPARWPRPFDSAHGGRRWLLVPRRVIRQGARPHIVWRGVAIRSGGLFNEHPRNCPLVLDPAERCLVVRGPNGRTILHFRWRCLPLRLSPRSPRPLHSCLRAQGLRCLDQTSFTTCLPSRLWPFLCRSPARDWPRGWCSASSAMAVSLRLSSPTPGARRSGEIWSLTLAGQSWAQLWVWRWGCGAGVASGAMRPWFAGRALSRRSLMMLQHIRGVPGGCSRRRGRLAWSALRGSRCVAVAGRVLGFWVGPAAI